MRIKRSARRMAYAAAALTLSALILSGCSGKKKELSVDVSALASELNGCVTSEALTAAASEMIPTIYYLSADDIISASAYLNSGATACEVTVVEMKDEDKAKDAVEKFNARVSSQSELYASYNPGEVEKLKNAAVKNAGKYAVLAVTDDSKKADEIIKKAGF